MKTHAEVPWRLEMLGGELHIVSGHDPAKRIVKVLNLYGDGSVFPVDRIKENANFIIRAANAYYGLLAACEQAINFIWDEMRENPDKEDMDGSIIERLIELQTGLISAKRKAKGGA
jgi:hypothetical protein